MTEIEAKFLDIDLDDFRQKLARLNAKLVHAEQLMKRRNFDYPDGRLEKIGGWVRIRDEGEKVTLAYKQLNERTVNGMKEFSVTVNDFETACNLLTAIGLEEKSYQETRRERWDLDGVEVTLDTWPWIPPFVELEAVTEKDLEKAILTLGLDLADAKYGSVEVVYQKHFDVTEAEINAWKSIPFSPVPAWLEAKRI